MFKDIDGINTGINLWKNFEKGLSNIDYPPEKYGTVVSVKGYYDGVPETLYSIFKDWINEENKNISTSNIQKTKEESVIEDLIKSNSNILNFNYTQTIEKHFYNESLNILHIHGTVDDPIFGHSHISSNSMKNQNIYVSNNDILKQNLGDPEEEYDKYQAATTKDTEGIYRTNRSWFKKFAPINQITFFGVSYSDVDSDYYRYMQEDKLFSSKCKFICYYHNDDSQVNGFEHKLKDFGILREPYLKTKKNHIIVFQNQNRTSPN